MQHPFFICSWILTLLSFFCPFFLFPNVCFLHPPLHTLSPSLLSGILHPAPQQVAVPSLSGVGGMVRPVTGADMGIRRAEIRPGLREIILCKDQDGKVGLRLRAIDNVSQHYILFDTCVNYLAQTDGERFFKSMICFWFECALKKQLAGVYHQSLSFDTWPALK